MGTAQSLRSIAFKKILLFVFTASKQVSLYYRFISCHSSEAVTVLLLRLAFIEHQSSWPFALLFGSTSGFCPFTINTNDNNCFPIFRENLWKTQASEAELCCICFDQVCTIEVQECGHQMCAHCTLALCCHNKPNPTTACHRVPVCPFCRSSITRLSVAEIKNKDDKEILEISPIKPRKSREGRHFSEGSSSFKSLTAMGSFGKMGGRNQRKVASEEVDKP